MATVSPVQTLPRRLGPGLTWMGGCATRPTDPTHVHHSNYLLQGERSLLVDTGFPGTWAQVDAHLDELLGGEPLDYVFPTHSEIAHSGNLNKLLQKYPKLRAVGDMRDFHLYYPEYRDRLLPVRADAEFDLGGGLQFRFLRALIADLPNTLWAYEATNQILFVADAFAYSHRRVPEEGEDPIHLRGECALTSAELPLPSTDQMAFVLRAAFNWTRYVDVSPIFDELEELLRRYPSRFVGPAHGNLIVDLDRMMPVVRAAFDEVYQGKS